MHHKQTIKWNCCHSRSKHVPTPIIRQMFQALSFNCAIQRNYTKKKNIDLIRLKYATGKRTTIVREKRRQIKRKQRKKNARDRPMRSSLKWTGNHRKLLQHLENVKIANFGIFIRQKWIKCRRQQKRNKIYCRAKWRIILFQAHAHRLSKLFCSYCELHSIFVWAHSTCFGGVWSAFC